MWAVTNVFHKYLCGNQLDAYTGNNPLIHVLPTAKLDATGHGSVTGYLLTILTYIISKGNQM